jgi:hypothetical protein
MVTIVHRAGTAGGLFVVKRAFEDRRLLMIGITK